MGALRTLESKLEGLVEGVFNRAFRARVQPVELARRLAKEMDSYKTVSVSRTYVPNEYIVFLSREDRRQFENYEQALQDELSQHLLEHAGREGLSLLTRPQVRFETDQRLRMGEFGIQPRLVKPPQSEHEQGSQGDLGATMVYSAAKAREVRQEAVAPPAVSRALLTMDGKTFVIDRPRTVIGRSQRADLVLDDPNVSRRHCEIQQQDGGWQLVDLESTNGVAVNGHRVRTAQLSPGDRITIGTSALLFDVD
jgi:pSer/pThr/pTyr-binding forkhead associated (FHA) protein